MFSPSNYLLSPSYKERAAFWGHHQIGKTYVPGGSHAEEFFLVLFLDPPLQNRRFQSKINKEWENVLHDFREVILDFCEKLFTFCLQ